MEISLGKRCVYCRRSYVERLFMEPRDGEYCCKNCYTRENFGGRSYCELGEHTTEKPVVLWRGWEADQVLVCGAHFAAYLEAVSSYQLRLVALVNALVGTVKSSAEGHLSAAEVAELVMGEYPTLFGTEFATAQDFLNALEAELGEYHFGFDGQHYGWDMRFLTTPFAAYLLSDSALGI